MLKVILQHHSKMGVLFVIAAIMWEYPRIMMFQYLLGMVSDTIQSNTQPRGLRVFQSMVLAAMVAAIAHDLSVFNSASSSTNDFSTVSSPYPRRIWKYAVATPMTLCGGLVRILGVPVYSLVVAVWEAVVVLYGFPLDEAQYSRLHDAYVQELRSHPETVPPPHLLTNLVYFATSSSPLSTTSIKPDQMEPLWTYARFSGKIVIALFFCVVYGLAAFCNAPGLDAARNCDVDSARRALSRGTDPNSKGQDKATALHICGQQALPEMARLLLEAGADANVRDSLGFSPLHWAVQLRREEPCVEKRLEIIRVLLEYGANPRLEDFRGNTPLSIASRAENARAGHVIAMFDRGDERFAPEATTTRAMAFPTVS
ncbi:hypothetical protein DYB32_006233 [Aphanomyces invadans]|uniref:Uncharacterized protein n=1 Tax=Aphanomyces invadans TaxID=157072 RepID=A0A3R7A753_9STRA|nr:hypothetical protein DYB32_006233 [Aphanomyces invadans]